jgi:hypothetical protein
MAIGDYPTPAQAGIYIGEWHIDDAYSVDWNWRSTTSPLFDYRRPRMVNAAIGKELVVGSLSINFRYPGYLFHAISETLKNLPQDLAGPDIATAIEAARNGTSYVEHYLDVMRSGTIAERINLLMEAAVKGPTALRKVSALGYVAENLLKADSDSGGKRLYPDVFDAQYSGLGRVYPVDIWVHYGDLDEPHVAKLIKNVVFTTKGEQVHAGAMAAGGLSASGINVLELYSFFAQTVESYTMDPSS